MGVDLKVKETETIAQWGKIMGEAVEKRTKNIYIKNKILYLEINSSVMRDELQQSKSSIIEKMNSAAGFELINNIYFR